MPSLLMITCFIGLGLFIHGCGEKSQITFTEDPTKPDLQDADATVAIARQWLSSEASEKTITIETGFGIVSQELSLKQAPNTEETLLQINRPINTVSSFQGHDGDDAEESYAISEAGLMDLLIIIDDSDSMDGYQQKIANALPSILKHVGNTNWRIAVATTSDPCLRTTNSGMQILTKAIYENDSTAAQAAFSELIDVGVRSSYERGILMAAGALEGQCGEDITPWLRPQSQVSVLIVTDEENCGSASNEGCAGEAWETADYLTSRFDPAPVVHGLLLLNDPPPGSDSSCDNSGYYDDPPNPSNYIDLITSTGGIYDDICTSDYGRVLEQVSQSVSDKINVQFELSYSPVGAVEIEIDGARIGSYFVDENILTITEDVPNGANTINIKYKHTPVSKSRYYSTNRGVDTSTLSVMVNGVLADPELYDYNDNTRQVVFKELPANRSKIELIFREDIELKKDFIFSQAFIDESLKIYINGEEESNFTVDMPSRKLSLANAPFDASEIKLVYEKSEDKTLEYEVAGVDPDKLESFKAYDAETLEELSAEINLDNKLSFNRQDIYDGRKIKVEYNTQFSKDERTFSLPINKDFSPESLTISADGNSTVCQQEIQVSDQELGFYCEDEDFEKIEITYTELENFQNSFTLDFDYAGPVRWTVYVNGKEFDKFHVFDKTVVILKKDLPGGATVRVEVHPVDSISS